MYLLYGIPEILTYDIINELRLSDNVATMKEGIVRICLFMKLYDTYPSQGTMKSRSTYSMICCNCRSTVLPKIRGKFDGFLMGFGKSKMLLLIEEIERDLIRICSVHGGKREEKVATHLVALYSSFEGSRFGLVGSLVVNI